MNFDLTDEQKDIIKAAREFAEKEFPDLAQECDREEKSPRHLWEKACELGFVGVFIPETYGGAGLGYLEHCLINEEFWRVDPGIAHFILAGTFGSEVILLFGTEGQKNKWVPPLVKGKAITGAAITEPMRGAMFPPFEPPLFWTAMIMSSMGPRRSSRAGTLAHYLLVLCVTESHARSPHDRFNVIMVKTDRKGFEANKLKNKLGLRASDTAEISFSDVKVPKENLVGTAGRGFHQFMAFFDHTRLHVCAEAVGLAQGAMEQAIKHVQKRQQFGKPLASFQVTQFKIAEMATLIETAGNLTYKAALALDRGNPDTQLSAMAKWWASYVAVKVADEALQLHGGYGYLDDYPIERYYRAAKLLEVYEGTKEIQKMTIGRRILGRT